MCVWGWFICLCPCLLLSSFSLVWLIHGNQTGLQALNLKLRYRQCLGLDEVLVQAGNRHGCCFRLIPEIGWSRRGQRHVVSSALSLKAEPGRIQSTLCAMKVLRPSVWVQEKKQCRWKTKASLKNVIFRIGSSRWMSWFQVISTLRHVLGNGYSRKVPAT